MILEDIEKLLEIKIMPKTHIGIPKALPRRTARNNGIVRFTQNPRMNNVPRLKRYP